MSGSRAVGTHHDSPHIDLKARPIYVAGDFALFKTIYYGGIKKYQWANRPLALIGRIDTADGKRVDVSLGLKPGDPVFVIPDNAPHSDKDLRERTYEKVFSGEELDPVAGSVPGETSPVTAQVVAALKSAYGIEEEDFVSAELALVPAAPPADVGVDRGLVGAYGQDDRLSSYCAARAILDLSGTPRRTAIAYLSNFEEVDSVNNTGAASQLLNSSTRASWRRSAARRTPISTCAQALRHAEAVSADVNDGVNPVFPQTSEPSNAARLGFGVTIKKYGAGFDANSEYTARIRAILDANAHSLADADPAGRRLLRRHDRSVPLVAGDGGHRHGRAAPVDALAVRDVVEGGRLVLLPVHARVLRVLEARRQPRSEASATSDRMRSVRSADYDLSSASAARGRGPGTPRALRASGSGPGRNCLRGSPT